MIASSSINRMVPAVILVSAIAGAAAYVSPLAALGMMFPVALVFILLFPRLGLSMLVVLAAMNRLAYPWGDSQIRVELAISLLLACTLLNRIAVRTVSISSLKSPLLAPVWTYAMVNVLSTLLFSHEKIRGLKLDAQIITAALTYMVVVYLLRHRFMLRYAVRLLWTVTVVEATIGIAALLLYMAHVSSFGIQLGDFGLPMVYGTQWEANIFGSYLLGNFFLLLADFVQGQRSMHRSIGLAIVAVGIAISMTRSVWLGLVVGLVVFVIALNRLQRGPSGGNLVPILAGIPVLALIGIIAGSATPFAARILDLVNLHSSSASGRFVIFSAAIADWRHNPLFGLGTGSFTLGTDPNQPHAWLPNLFLLTLHDTGIVGVSVLFWLIWAYYRTLGGVLRSTHDLRILAVGAMASMSGLLVAFQTTTGFWFVYPWIVIGLGVAVALQIRDEAVVVPHE